MSLAADLKQRTRFATLEHLVSCDSTQARSRSFVPPPGGDDAWAVFWADHQSAGRGRQGRVWSDAAGQDLAVTLRVTGLELANPSRLAAAIPVAIIRALPKLAALDEVRLKWPNDLLLSGRKLCGVLIDSEGQPASLHHIGIGININRTDFPEELREQSTSLALATGVVHDREALLLQLAIHVDAAIAELQSGTPDALAEQFSDRLGLLGRRVRAVRGRDEVYGELTHLDLDHIVLDGNSSIALAHLRALSLA